MYSSDNNKVFKSCIALVTLRNSYVMMHGPMNIKKGVNQFPGKGDEFYFRGVIEDHIINTHITLELFK